MLISQNLSYIETQKCYLSLKKILIFWFEPKKLKMIHEYVFLQKFNIVNNSFAN